MSSIIYNKHRERLQTGLFDWLTATVKVAFVAGDYVADVDDEFLSAVPGSAILIRSGAMTGKTADDGFAAGLTPEFLLYRNARPTVGILLYQDTGVDATSNLICYSDDGPGLPFVGLGFNYAVSYNATLGGFYQA
jgi:hypothetical protein